MLVVDPLGPMTGLGASMDPTCSRTRVPRAVYEQCCGVSGDIVLLGGTLCCYRMVCVKSYPHECQDPRFLNRKFEAKENKMGIGPLVTPKLPTMFAVV